MRCLGYGRVCGFGKKSRVNFSNANKLHRKSGEWCRCILVRHLCVAIFRGIGVKVSHNDS
jgi:hypothetical protein